MTLEDVKMIKTECEVCTIIKLICYEKHFKEALYLPLDKYAELNRTDRHHVSLLMIGLKLQSGQTNCSQYW